MSEYLNKLIARGRESLWDEDGNDWRATPEKPQSIFSVKHDSFDELSWRMLTDQVGVLKDAVHELAEDHGTSEEAQEDVFNLLHQTDPQFRPAEEVKPTHRPQRDMLDRLFESPPFEELRQDTVLDEYNTAFSQLCLQGPLREAFDELNKAQEGQAAAQQALQQAMEQAQQAQSEGQKDAAEQSMEQALQQVEQAQEQTTEQVEQATKALQQKTQETQEELHDEVETMSNYGLGPGELRQMPYEERRALAERLHQSRLAKLSKLIGAFRQFGDAERRRKIKHAPSVIYDVEMGNDLTRLVAQEVNNLAIPELEDQFWLSYTKRSLLQWDVHGPETAGLGPIILVCDESGSMDAKLDAEGNTREAWSKALSLALADQARRGKRDFTYIGFGNASQQWERTFPGGRTTLDDVIEFTGHFYSGGTHYETPLARAMEIAQEYARRGQSQPDIVLITDDCCKVDDDFVEEFARLRERTGSNCYGIQVGEKSYGSLARLADRTLSITKLTASPEGVQDLFRTI